MYPVSTAVPGRQRQ